MERLEADICLILEGTYPYVTGGVSNWTHELIRSQPHLTFALLCILPSDGKTNLKFDLPDNVIAVENVFLQKLPRGERPLFEKEVSALFKRIEIPLVRLQYEPSLQDLREIIEGLRDTKLKLGTNILLHSQEAWQMIVRMYSTTMGDSSFLNFFWSWIGLLGSFFSVMLGTIPPAKVYHALCTGYAGLFLARAHLEKGKPCLLTEHGIYTNERRIEIMAASWLDDMRAMDLSVDRPVYVRDLKDFWVETFKGYSRLTYEVCETIVTLYEENRTLQVMDGADEMKVQIVPNGIDVTEYEKIERSETHPPTVALIGRIVPIKDVKNYLYAVSLLKEHIPQVRALVLGGWDEDPDYYRECENFVHALGLDDTVQFTGRVNVKEYLGSIDVIALTSISEVMPLVVLEGGAAGIPCVCTNVGACSELIYGRSDEEPKMGPGGAICPLSSPTEIANQVLHLLLNKQERLARGQNLKRRIMRYYNKPDVDKFYAELYNNLIEKGSLEPWQA